jgi:antitoxin ParD1/3/4
MATRNINLTDALDRFVAEKVASGSYQNASEVVRAGLRLLAAEEALRAERIKRLNAEIQPAIDDIEAGRYTIYENARAMFDGVEKRAQAEAKRRRARKK